MMTKVDAFCACMTLALVVGCGGQPSNVDVDTPSSVDVDTPSNVDVDKPEVTKTDIAEQPTTEEPQTPTVDIWKAASQGNIEAIQQHLATGTDPNAKEPGMGGTPLIAAALFGQTEAARLLIEKGADLTIKSDDGSAALHFAAFFGQPEIVKLLLEKGAEVNAKNNKGETPLDTVAAEWGQELEGAYRLIAGRLQVELDLERIKGARPQIAEVLREHGGKSGGEES